MITIGGVQYSTIDSALDIALRSNQPVFDEYGREMRVSMFMGGWLLNDCPLNVVFGQGWLAGQMDALLSAGITGCLPAAPMEKPTGKVMCLSRVEPTLNEIAEFPGSQCPVGWVPYDPAAPRYQDIQPSLTPPPIGKTNGGGGVMDTGPLSPVVTIHESSEGGVQFMPGDIYRFILFTARPLGSRENPDNIDYPDGGTYDTGASYPGCRIGNPEACIPMQFSSIQEAVSYAVQHGEIPVVVYSAEEAWEIAEGRRDLPESQIIDPSKPLPTLHAMGGFLGSISPAMLAIGAGAAILMFGGFGGGRSGGGRSSGRKRR